VLPRVGTLNTREMVLPRFGALKTRELVLSRVGALKQGSQCFLEMVPRRRGFLSPRFGALKRIDVLHNHILFFINFVILVNYIYIIDFKYNSIVDLLW